MDIKKPGESEKIKECYEDCTAFGDKRDCKLIGLLVVTIPQDLKDWATTSGTILDIAELLSKADVPATSGIDVPSAIINAWIRLVSDRMEWRVYAVCEFDDCEWCETVPGYIRRGFGEKASDPFLKWSKWRSASHEPLKPEWGGDFTDVEQDSEGTIKIPQSGFTPKRREEIFRKILDEAKKQCENICKTKKR